MKNFGIKITVGFLFILYSCSNNGPFNEEGLFYKSINLQNTVYLTFLNDSLAVFNPGELEECQWYFQPMKINNDLLYKTNDLKLDSMIIRRLGEELYYSIPGDTMIFQQTNLANINLDSLQKNIKILYHLSNKGISYDCKFSIDEVKFFYNEAITMVKENIKNPGSAKFKTVSIDPYMILTNTRDFFQSTTTFVTIELEGKNSFGNYVEDTVYVFFIPKVENSKSYEVIYSKSSILESEFRKLLMPEYDSNGKLIKLN